MKIYTLVNDSNKYLALWPADRSLFDDLYDQFTQCHSLTSTWTPLKCVWDIDPDDRRSKRLKVADITRLAVSAPVLFPEGWTILKPLIEHEIESLPLETPTGTALAINTLTLIDALDHPRCQFSYYSDGKIMRVKKYMFVAEKLKNTHIFRVPECKSDLFVTDAFKQLVESHKLTGAWFTCVWDSEST